MTIKLAPGKQPLWITILCVCIMALAGLYHAQLLFDPGSDLTPAPPDPKQELRAQYAQYREGRLPTRELLKTCLDKARSAEKNSANGKSDLAEYAYALRSQVYLDEDNPQAALAEARNAADAAPSPGRGVVALGDALRALGKDDEAAGAYRQALFNPDYTPEYTVEDPMDTRTLNALFAAGKGSDEEREFENVTVRGKMIDIVLSAHWLESFFSIGIDDPFTDILCYFWENPNVRIVYRPAPNKATFLYLVNLAKGCGLFLVTQTQGKMITTSGLARTSSYLFVYMVNCQILRIEP